jgi:hypothetical protein
MIQSSTFSHIQMGFQDTLKYGLSYHLHAQSAEFCSTIVHFNWVLETTGGGNSDRPNQCKANMIQALLATAKKIFGHLLPHDLPIQKFWCFPYAHASYTHC